MIRISFRHICLGVVASALVIAAHACGDSLGLPPPQFENRVDTVTLHALTGTDIVLPSAYDLISRTTARTDQAQPFDIAFELDADGRALIFPARALGQINDAALQVSSETFGAITTAPLEGYQADSAQAVTAETVFIVRSRFDAAFCVFLGAIPRYGKFRVLAVDPTTRTITLEALVNQNCGFRSLAPGLPTS